MASSSAADTQAASARNAQQISQNEFNTIQQQNQPFIQSGYGALGELNYLLGTGPNPNAATGVDYSSGFHVGPNGQITQRIPSVQAPFGGSQNGFGALFNGAVGGAANDIRANAPSGAPMASSSPAGGFGSLLQGFNADTFRQYSPAYQFQQQQGMQGVLNQASTGGSALGGAASKDLIDYNQSLANTAFNNAFNQYNTQQNNVYSRLAGVAQLGQASANQTGQQGTALAGQAANSALAQGAYQAAGTVGIANALGGAASSASYAPWLSSIAGGGSGIPDLQAGGGAFNTGNISGGQLWGD